jgi:hypothetical protein
VTGYATVTRSFQVNLAALSGSTTQVVNCPTGTSVLTSFIYRISLNDRYPFPPGVDVTGWPDLVDRTKWTFKIFNATSGAYVDPVEAGLVCASTAN